MKRQHIMDEVDKSIQDKNERQKVLEGVLGYILCSTQVMFLICLLSLFVHLHLSASLWT